MELIWVNFVLVALCIIDMQMEAAERMIKFIQTVPLHVADVVVHQQMEPI